MFGVHWSGSEQLMSRVSTEAIGGGLVHRGWRESGVQSFQFLVTCVRLGGECVSCVLR